MIPSKETKHESRGKPTLVALSLMIVGLMIALGAYAAKTTAPLRMMQQCTGGKSNDDH